MDFVAFPKIPRLRRGIVITEKIDGTNAQIKIEYLQKPLDGDDPVVDKDMLDYFYGPDGSAWGIWVGSRNRWLKPGKEDNVGFAGWVKENKQELIKLGPGEHFGEWWGQGIQRRYGLTEKRFSLFNAGRWTEPYHAMLKGYENSFPKCCHVVPILYEGPFNDAAIDGCIDSLRVNGSVAAPGFMDPEGIIVFHTASRSMAKVTCKNDDQAKGQIDS